MITGAVPGVRRGCGVRKEGQLYAECGLSKYGRPVEDFLMCPPQRVDLGGLGIEPLGVRLYQFPSGVYNVFDWVGSGHYPYVTDFIEEVRRFGLSRRFPKNMELDKLTVDSRLLLIHASATILNPRAMKEDRIGGLVMNYSWKSCPRGIEHPFSEHCIGLCWEDVEDVKSHPDYSIQRIGTRKMPSFWYKAAKPPGIRATRHEPAVFAIFPITRFVVVRARDGSHEETLKRVESKSNLPVAVVDN